MNLVDAEWVPGVVLMGITLIINEDDQLFLCIWLFWFLLSKMFVLNLIYLLLVGTVPL